MAGLAALTLFDEDGLGRGVEISHLQTTKLSVAASSIESGLNQLLEPIRASGDKAALLLDGQKMDTCRADPFKPLHIPPGSRARVSTGSHSKVQGSVQARKNTIGAILPRSLLILCYRVSKVLHLVSGLPCHSAGGLCQRLEPILDTALCQLGDRDLPERGKDMSINAELHD